MAYTKYSLTPADNNAAPPNGAPEGMLPSAVNDTMRDMMSQIRDVGDGIRGGTYTMTAPVITGGSITGSTINNSAIGGTTAAAGKFTTLEATGVATFSAGTVSAPAITTTGDTNTGIFFPAADTIAFTEGGVESMRIDSSGNVGIGTNSPTVISGFTATSIGGTNKGLLTIRSSGTTDAGYVYYTGAQFSIESVALPLNFSSGSANPMTFGTNSAERMRIDGSTGNVGIGTSSPASKFHVSTNTESNTPVARFQNYNLGDLFVATFKNAGSDSNARLAGIEFTGDADVKFGGIGGRQGGILSLFSATGGTLTERMRIDSSGNVGIGTSSPTQKLDVRSAVAISDGTVNFVAGAGAFVGGQFGLGTTSNNLLAFATNNTERMRIDSSGNLLVGTTTSAGVGGFSVTPNSDAGSAQVFFNRNTTASTSFAIIFRDGGSTKGSISYTNTATAFNTSSDYRLKENIAPMTGALGVVQQLKPVTYNWKVDGSSSQGFIAHELQAVVPDCVTGEKDAVDADGKPVYQGIDTSFLVATLTAAIQEQQTLIENLTTRLNALEGN